MKRNSINFPGIIVELALLALTLLAAIMLIRIGAAVAADGAKTRPNVTVGNLSGDARVPNAEPLRHWLTREGEPTVARKPDPAGSSAAPVANSSLAGSAAKPLAPIEVSTLTSQPATVLTQPPASGETGQRGGRI